MQKKIKGLLPHAAILICNMYVVFYLIDRVNKAMNFIDNGLTKGLLLILCVITLVNVRELTRHAPKRKPARGGDAPRPRSANEKPAPRHAPSGGRGEARR